MNKKECLQILAIAKAAYPYFKIEDAEAMCQAWLMCLAEYDANNIVNALKIHITKSKYFPSIAEIIEEHRRALYIYGDMSVKKTCLPDAENQKLIGESDYKDEFDYLSSVDD